MRRGVTVKLFISPGECGGVAVACQLCCLGAGIALFQQAGSIAHAGLQLELLHGGSGLLAEQACQIPPIQIQLPGKLVDRANGHTVVFQIKLCPLHINQKASSSEEAFLASKK